LDFARTYRALHRQDDLVHFRVAVKETDLDIGVRRRQYSPELADWCEKLVMACRTPLEEYVKTDPDFVRSLSPYSPLPGAPAIARAMAEAGRAAGVGPMAAVAGAVAEEVGKTISRRSRDVIVENGGDIFIKSNSIRRIGIFAGQSVLSNRLALEIRPEQTPLGICTSSGTVGHSLSYGSADAVVILSPSTPLADAVATATGNMIKEYDDMEKAMHFAMSIEGILGALVIKKDKLAAKGRLKIVPI
jgi:ApbE superfamily uncharacterized protein (UPF0280 family)